LVGCSAGVVAEPAAAQLAPPYSDYEEQSDFLDDGQQGGKADGVPSTFPRRLILEKELYLGATARGAQEAGLSPVVLLVRMQVEMSLISKSSRPSSHAVDFALGCGCPDGSGCGSAYDCLAISRATATQLP
jgi:hypothetical protein